VRSSIRGNAAAAKFRCLSQVRKRYVTSEWSADPLLTVANGRYRVGQ